MEAWIDARLGPDYAWPGNVRELDQCLRNILIRQEYHPARPRQPISSGDPYQRLTEDMRDRKLSADEVMRRYCSLVYREEENFERAAKRLKLDRRTVKSKVDGS